MCVNVFCKDVARYISAGVINQNNMKEILMLNLLFWLDLQQFEIKCKKIIINPIVKMERD